jgi:hypothetical protein
MRLCLWIPILAVMRAQMVKTVGNVTSGILSIIFVDLITETNLIPNPPGLYPAFRPESGDLRFSDRNLERLADYRDSLPDGAICPRLFWDEHYNVILPIDPEYRMLLSTALARDPLELSWDEYGRLVEDTENVPERDSRRRDDLIFEDWIN